MKLFIENKYVVDITGYRFENNDRRETVVTLMFDDKKKKIKLNDFVKENLYDREYGKRQFFIFENEIQEGIIFNDALILKIDVDDYNRINNATIVFSYYHYVFGNFNTYFKIKKMKKVFEI